MIPSSDAPSRPWHSSHRMANASTTSSPAKWWSIAVAPSSYVSRGGSTLVFSWRQSVREFAVSGSGIFAHCGPCCICRLFNRRLVQWTSNFLALNHGKHRTRWNCFIGKNETSNWSIDLRCSNYWTKRLAFRLSIADSITLAFIP
jgi:hypothetical protein